MSKKLNTSHYKYVKLLVIFVIFIILIFTSVIYLYIRSGSFPTFINSFFIEHIKVNPQETLVQSDHVAPVITIKQGPLHTLQSQISISIKTNEEVTIPDSSYKLIYLGDEGLNKFYVLEVTSLDLGEKVIEINFQDNFGNKTTQSFDIARTPLGLNNLSTIPENLDWPNSTYIKDGELLSSPANKEHKLTTDFQPPNLISLKDRGLTVNSPDILLRADAANFLNSMVLKLQEDTGKSLTIASGYRSYNNQVQTYLYWVSLYGQEHADTISARPGFSEHQLGTTVDFMSGDSGYDFVNTFDQTVAGQWLINNAYKYGFVQSYPYGKNDITGYSYEAWHYRYIGVDVALQWKDSGKTLKEFLEGL